MSSEEWGPSVEHDGRGCPLQIGQYVRCRERAGGEAEGVVNKAIVTAPNWWWPKKSIGRRQVHYETDVVAYRIRRPRAPVRAGGCMMAGFWLILIVTFPGQEPQAQRVGWLINQAACDVAGRGMALLMEHATPGLTVRFACEAVGVAA